jgi:O-Antigen ligase
MARPVAGHAPPAQQARGAPDAAAERAARRAAGAPPRFLAVIAEVLDWTVLFGALALLAWSTATGLTFMPAAGFLGHRLPLLMFEQASLAIAAGAGVRWLLNGRVLPGAPLTGLAAVAVLGLLAIAHTSNLYSTREELFLLIAITMYTLGLLVVLADRVKTHAFFAGLAGIACWEAAQGLGQYAAGLPTPAYWLSPSFADLIHTRVYGTLASPNVLAGFLLLGTAAACVLAISLPRWLRPIAAAAAVVQVLAIMLTYSRGGYAGLAVFVVASAALLFPVRRRAWWVLALIVVTAAVAAARLPAVGLRAERLAPGQEDTVTSRRFIWESARRMWAGHRLWGAGLGTFNVVYSAYRPPGVYTTYAMINIPASAHDDYLQILAETGVVGAGIVGATLLWGLWRAAVRYRAGPEEDRIWLGAGAAAAAGVGVMSLVDENLYVITNLTLMAAFAAAVSAHAARHRPAPLPIARRLFVLPLAVVFIGLPPLLVPPVVATVLHAEASDDVAALRFSEAVDTFRTALPLDPLNSVIPTYFGDLATDLYTRRLTTGLGPWPTMRDVAERYYRQAMADNAWDAYPRIELGRLLRDERRYPEAVAAFQEGVRLDAYTPQYRLWFGEALRLSGDRRGARREYEEAARLYPVNLVLIEHHEGRSTARYTTTQREFEQVQAALRELGPAP